MAVHGEALQLQDRLGVIILVPPRRTPFCILHPTGRNQGGGIFKAAGISYLPSVYREVIENTDFNHKGHVQDWFTLNWLPTDSNIDMCFFCAYFRPVLLDGDC